MKQTNYLKLFSIFAFLIFGGVSCWATAESLHLLLASWPKIFCYFVAAGFFVVASIGTKLIVDSLNQKIYVEGRTGKLIGGIIMVLIFWLATSMPTNTHTFIYRNVISERVNNDINVTMGYLEDVVKNTVNEENCAALTAERVAIVKGYQNRLMAELNQPNDPGSGPRAEKILNELETKYGYRIERYRNNGNNSNLREVNRAVEFYNTQFNDLIENTIPGYYRDKIVRPNETNLEQAINAYEALADLKEKIEAGKTSKGSSAGNSVDLNSAEDMHDIVIPRINAGYQAVNSNHEMVRFRSGDEAKYRAIPVVTETQRMTSIFEVWGDYIAGKFNGHGFFWWILLAVLIDIAAFIFFDIAFKKSEY